LAITQTQDPSFQQFLNASGQSNLDQTGQLGTLPYASGGLYGRLRAATLGQLLRQRGMDGFR